MLIKVKHSNKTHVEFCSKFSNLFLKEYYLNILENDIISEQFKFNDVEIISRDIKDKSRIFYLIQDKNEDKQAGYISFYKNQDILYISQIFILKNHRGKCLLKDIIEEIKDIALKSSFKTIGISILENKKKIQEIFKGQGFIKKENSAKYIGDNIYIYEDEFTYTV